MLPTKPFQVIVAVCTSLGMLVSPCFSAAADPVAPGARSPQPVTAAAAAEKVRDVKLGEGGELLGQLVDGQASPLAGRPVRILQDDQVVAATTTEENGNFAIQGLKGGTYMIDAMGARASVRLWSAGTAPPAAIGGALLVAQGNRIRGNLGNLDRIKSGMFRADEAAAIAAIPLAIGVGAVIQKERQDDNELPPAS